MTGSLRSVSAGQEPRSNPTTRGQSYGRVILTASSAPVEAWDRPSLGPGYLTYIGLGHFGQSENANLGVIGHGGSSLRSPPLFG